MYPVLKPRDHFPFTAVTAQLQFKLALLLAAINPLIGGVLVSGPRGSAKSTLAKGLVDILPEREGLPLPFVTLPLGASEEMLIGTLNLQQVLEDKTVAFQSGLLAKAHNGVLYVDEVNLLPDNLVDQLLDVSASGINFIERDGISHQHAAEFILLGTMNPDEGELRPQLLDRFGLSVVLSNQYSIEERIQVVKLREAFDKHPDAFMAEYAEQQQQLKHTIISAQQLISSVVCDDACRQLIAERCEQAQVDGLRADIVWVQAAIAHASLHQNHTVTTHDILAVESLVLNHRRNNHEQGSGPQQHTPDKPPFSRPHDKSNASGQAANSTQQPGESEANSQEGDWGAMSADSHQQSAQSVQPINVNHSLEAFIQPTSNTAQRLSLNRLKGGSRGMRQSTTDSHKVNWFSTLVNNVQRQQWERLYFFKKKQGESVVHLVLLDTSASILHHQGFGKAKGVILQIAKAAYLRREQFALMGFGNQHVETLMGVRRAPKAIERLLDNIEASGGTPLHAALQQAENLQRQLLRQHQQLQFKNTIITDGRVSQLTFNGKLQGEVVVVDVEQSAVKRGKSRQLAELLRGHYVPLLT